MLLPDDDSSSDGHESDEVEVEVEVATAVAQPASMGGGNAEPPRRRARRKGGADARDSPALGDDDWDGLAQTGAQSAAAATPSEQKESAWWEERWEVRAAYLSPDAELSERFGHRTISAARAGRPATAQSGRARGVRRGILAPASLVPAGPPARAGGGVRSGLWLERDEECAPHAGGAQAEHFFRYRYSNAYRQLAEHAAAAALAGDGRALRLMLREVPSHVEVLASLAAIVERRQGEGEQAQVFIEEALRAYELGLPGLGSATLAASLSPLLDPRCRLRVGVRENAAFVRLLAKRAAHVSRCGCPRTASELCRLILGLTLTLARADAERDAAPQPGAREQLPRRRADRARLGRAREAGRGGGAEAEAEAAEGQGALLARAQALSGLGTTGCAAVDPEHVLLRIDSHLSSCGRLPLLRALPSLCGHATSLALWPNLAFSLALSHRAAGEPELASAQLRRALLLFPAALRVLLLGAERAGQAKEAAETPALGRAEALLANWRAALSAVSEVTVSEPAPPRQAAKSEHAATPASASSASAWECADEPAAAHYRPLLELYLNTPAGREWAAATPLSPQTGARGAKLPREWLVEVAAELSAQLSAAAAHLRQGDAPDERGARATSDDADASTAHAAAAAAAASAALALARDCAAFRAAEWASSRAELEGVSLDELGLSPLGQVPLDGLGDEGEGEGRALGGARAPRRTGGLRLDLRGSHPLLVFIQSMLPWAYAPR